MNKRILFIYKGKAKDLTKRLVLVEEKIKELKK